MDVAAIVRRGNTYNTSKGVGNGSGLCSCSGIYYYKYWLVVANCMTVVSIFIGANELGS